jgi:predicted TIM-barrel fold metal-dependent hydrolase
MTAGRLLEEMDAAGVGGALVVTPTVYGNDNAYALEAHRLAPDRIRVVGRVDPGRPDIESLMRGWRAQPGMVGVRIVAVGDREREVLRAGAMGPILRGAAAGGVAVCVYTPGAPELVGELAREFPDTRLVLDHAGLTHPMVVREADPFGVLDRVLELARHGNISVKLTSLPLHSREPFPYPDLGPHIDRLLDAFGPERVMWGSDFTQHPEVPYRHAVDYLRASGRLDTAAYGQVMGQTLRSIFGW